MDSQTVALTAIIVSGGVTILSPIIAAWRSNVAAAEAFDRERSLRDEDHKRQMALRRAEFDHEWQLQHELRNQERVSDLYLETLEVIERIERKYVIPDMLDDDDVVELREAVDEGLDGIQRVRPRLATYGSKEVFDLAENWSSQLISFDLPLTTRDGDWKEQAERRLGRVQKTGQRIRERINAEMRGTHRKVAPD